MGMGFYSYLPFNIAIAAVSPIGEHDSAACVWNYTGLHEPRDHPASEIKEQQLISLWLWWL